MRNRLETLNGLRGILSWWVVSNHVSLTVGLSFGALNQSHLAVNVFIIMSGYVIFSLIDKKHEPYHTFITNRAFRIFPLYLCALIASAALLPIYEAAMQDIPFKTMRNTDRLDQVKEAIENFWPHLMLHIPLLQGLIPKSISIFAPHTILGQSWSISLQWQFYLIAPLLYTLAKNPKYWPLLCALVLALFMIPDMSRAFLGQNTLQFAIGCASYFILTKTLPLETMQLRVLKISFLAVLSGLLILMNGLPAMIPLTIWFLVVLPVTGFRPKMVVYIESVLKSKTLNAIGQRSYSVYLIHMIPLYIATYFLNGMNLDKPAFCVYLYISTLLGTAILSELTLRWIERPSIALGTKIGRWKMREISI